MKYGRRKFLRQTAILWADSRVAGRKLAMRGRPTPNRQRHGEIFVAHTEFNP